MDIVVFSPHLDDAVLDTCDHIRLWKAQGHVVEIVTVFSAFRGGIVSKDVRKYSGICNLTPREFEKVRKTEDCTAMQLLGVKWRHLDFVDGGFRVHKKKLIYRNFSTLFSGKVSLHDRVILEDLKKIMTSYIRFDRIIVPLGIGRHADHLLVRKAAEISLLSQKLGYYLDFPYALSFVNWSAPNILRYLFTHKSTLPFSDFKKECLACYGSQTLVLSSLERCSEVLLFHH